MGDGKSNNGGKSDLMKGFKLDNICENYIEYTFKDRHNSTKFYNGKEYSFEGKYDKRNLRTSTAFSPTYEDKYDKFENKIVTS